MNYKERDIFGFEIFDSIKNFKFDNMIPKLKELKFNMRNKNFYIYFTFNGTQFRMSRLYDNLPKSITHNSQLTGILWDNLERVKLEQGYNYGWSGGTEWNVCYEFYKYQQKLKEKN